MSRMSKVMESALRRTDFKKNTGDTKNAIEKMERRSADEDEHTGFQKDDIKVKSEACRCSAVR